MLKREQLDWTSEQGNGHALARGADTCTKRMAVPSRGQAAASFNSSCSRSMWS